MADSDTCVAYLVDSLYHQAGADVGPTPVARFLESYLAHDAGISHRLLVLRRGFRTAQAWAPYVSEFDKRGVAYEVLDVPDSGYDLGAYRQAVELSPADTYCFLNTSSEAMCDGWLEHLCRPVQLSGVGLAGATGSYESLYSAWLAAWSVHRANRSRRWLPPVRGYIMAHRLRSEYPAYPNPHVRTNGFAVTRSVARVLRWEPFRTKEDTQRGESGWLGLTHQADALGLRNVVAGRDGLFYEVVDWPASGTFRSGCQSNLVIADNRTRQYDASPPDERSRLGRLAWGAHYQACAAESP